jgi:hypothetical protein
MSLESFKNNINDLLVAIHSCESKRFILPSLILIYSGIDIIASLERRKGEGTKDSFTRWVDEYLLKKNPLPCTALELYAARCGILHALTAESDLSRKGFARQIIYAWGKGNESDLQKTAQSLGHNAIAIHVSELILAFQNGIDLFLQDISQDHDRAKNISEKHKSLWFSKIPLELIDEYMNLIKNDEGR